jgi:hypothetical protein
MKFQTFDQLERNQKHPLPAHPVIFILCVLVYAVIIWGIVAVAHAEIPNMAIIQRIESNGNPLAYNKHSGARGLYQLMPCVLQEYNQYNNTRYTKNDLFNASINTKIAHWYMLVRISDMLRAYRKPATIENYIKSYNAGIRSVVKGYMPVETRKYIAKYRKLEAR